MKFIWIFLIACSSLGLAKLHAQDTGFVHLTHSQLHAFEGVFQDQVEKERNLQIIEDSDGLLAKALWGTLILRLYPTSDLEFHTKDGERATIKFTKDPDGSINVLIVNGGGIWKRNAQYHPPVRNEISHSPEQLKAYVGFSNRNMIPTGTFNSSKRIINWY